MTRRDRMDSLGSMRNNFLHIPPSGGLIGEMMIRNSLYTGPKRYERAKEQYSYTTSHRDRAGTVHIKHRRKARRLY